MSKKPITIPAARTGRGVRWTLQVSADAGERAEQRGKPAAKRAAPTPSRKPSRRRADKAAVAAGTPAKGVSAGRKKKVARTKAAPVPVVAPVSAAASIPAAAAPVALVAPPAAAASSAVRGNSLAGGRRIAAIAVGVVLVLAVLALMRDPARGLSTSVSAEPATTLSDSGLGATEPAIVQAASPTPRARATSPANAAEPVAMTTRTPAAASPVERTTSAASAPLPVASSSVSPAVPPPSGSATPEPAARATAPDATSAALAPRSEGAAEAVNQAPVTITGCLEGSTDGDRFRLTDTQGAAAPKARGWRSGFLKKRPAAVELADLREPVALRKLIGHRVVATGLLDDRELRVRSVSAAGARCE